MSEAVAHGNKLNQVAGRVTPFPLRKAANLPEVTASPRYWRRSYWGDERIGSSGNDGTAFLVAPAADHNREWGSIAGQRHAPERTVVS